MTGLEPRELATVPFVVTGAGRASAGRPRRDTLQDLAGERFVDMLRGFGNRTIVDRAFDHAGHPAQGAGRGTRPDAPSRSTCVRGWEWPSYRRSTCDEQAGVTRLRLTDVDLTWTLSAITLSGKRPSRAVTALLDLLAGPVAPLA